MTHSLLFWLRLGLLLFMLFDVLLIIGSIVNYLLSIRKNIMVERSTKKLMYRIRLSVIWFFIGFALCDVLRYDELKTVQGPITVLGAYPGNGYRLNTPQYGQLDTVLCDPAPQFQKGHILKYIKYRYDYPRGCWMVNHSGGFDVVVLRDN